MSAVTPPGRLAGIALASTVAILLAGCASSGSDDAAEDVEQVLRFGLSGEPQPIVAGKSQAAIGSTLDTLVHRGLMARDDEGTVIPGLAETYEQIDTSTYSFTLYDGLEFSDGTALTSENVKESLLYYGDPDNGASVAQAMSNIDDIEVVSDTELTVHLTSGDPDFLQYLTMPEAFIAPTESLDLEATADIGAGPFIIESWEEGVQMTLTPNPSYYDADEVQLDAIELIFYADTAARTNALLSGDVDLIDYVAWEDYDRIRETDGLVMDDQPGLLMTVDFNTTVEPFDDPLVREAISYAINRDNIVDAVFWGSATAIDTWPVTSDEIESPAGMYTYDPEKAKELLTEAGYPDGFSATILTSAQYSFHEDMALSIQADLADIGVEITLDNPDWATRMEMFQNGEYQFATNGWGGSITSPAYLEAALVNNVLAPYGWVDDEFISAIAQGRSGETVEDRQAGYEEAFEILGTEVPLIPVVQRNQGFAYTESLKGFQELPGFLSFNQSGYALVDAYLE